MSVTLLKRSQVGMCLLCHDAPCTQACKGLDPARILRAIRFDNPYGGLALLPEQDACADCDGRCMAIRVSASSSAARWIRWWIPIGWIANPWGRQMP